MTFAYLTGCVGIVPLGPLDEAELILVLDVDTSVHTDVGPLGPARLAGREPVDSIEVGPVRGRVGHGQGRAATVPWRRESHRAGGTEHSQEAERPHSWESQGLGGREQSQEVESPHPEGALIPPFPLAGAWRLIMECFRACYANMDAVRAGALDSTLSP